MEQGHWSQKSSNVNGLIRTWAWVISQPVCVTTLPCCLLFPSVSWCVAWAPSSRCWIFCVLALATVTNNLQINKYLFLAHKSVVGSGSACLCSRVCLLFQDPGWRSPDLGHAVFTAEDRRAKGWVKPWNCIYSFCLDMGISHLLTSHWPKTVTWPSLTRRWKATDKVGMYNSPRARTDSWGKKYHLPQWGGD